MLFFVLFFFLKQKKSNLIQIDIWIGNKKKKNGSSNVANQMDRKLNIYNIFPFCLETVCPHPCKDIQKKKLKEFQIIKSYNVAVWD